MISKFKLDYSLSNEMMGENMLKVDLGKSNKLKIFIPSIMSNTVKGKKGAAEYIVYTKGRVIFKNSGNKPPKPAAKIKAQNYLVATMSDNSNIYDMKTTITELTKYLHTKNKDVDEHKISYVVKVGAPLRVKFLSGKVSKLSFTISGLTNPKISMKKVKPVSIVDKRKDDDDTFDDDPTIIVDPPTDTDSDDIDQFDD